MILKKNPHVKLLMLFVLVSILIVSCNDDELLQDNDTASVKSGLTVKIVSKEEILQNEKVAKRLDIINANISEQRRNPIYSDEYDMTIETDYAELVENEDGTVQSYTFDISRETNNGLLENFVLSLQEDGSYSGHYLAYDITNEEVDNIMNGIAVDLTDKVDIVEINDNDLILDVLATRVEGDEYEMIPISMWRYDDSCYQGVSNCQVGVAHHVGWVETITYVMAVSGGTNIGGVPDNADGGASNNNGPTPGISSSGSYAKPTRPINPNISNYNSFKKRYARTLGRDEPNILEENLFISQQVSDFLESHNFSDLAEEYALYALALNLIDLNIDIPSVLSFPITDLNKLGQCNNNLMGRTFVVQYFLEDTAFGQKIKNSFVTNNTRHIFITSEPTLPDNQVARTEFLRTPPFNSQLTGEQVAITFNQAFLNQASDISIVTYLFHELLHAYIINLYHDGELLTEYPQYTDLNSVCDAYVNHPNYPNVPANGTIGTNLQNEMHDIYVDFIDDLAGAVHDYATNNNIQINGENISLDYAENLVWASLEFEDVFSDNLNETEQQQAVNILGNEIQNNSNGTQTKSCN